MNLWLKWVLVGDLNSFKHDLERLKLIDSARSSNHKQFHFLQCKMSHWGDIN